MSKTHDRAVRQVRTIARIRERALKGYPIKLSDEETRLIWRSFERMLERIEDMRRHHWWQFWRKRVQ